MIHYFNHAKSYKSPRMKEREIEEARRALFKEETEKYWKWFNMLICNKKLKIIKGSAETVQNEYNNFRHSLKDEGKLGSIWSIGEPCITSCGNEVILSIQYSIFELKDGCSLNEYKKAIREFDDFKSTERLVE